MKLNLLERLTILNILPREGNFATLKILRDVQGVLSPSEAEFKEFGITTELNKETNQTQTNWNKKGIEEREINIGEKANDIIVETLKKLNDEKKLNPQHMSAYEKFVGDK